MCAQSFVGARVCASCHEAQAASHAQSGHAQSLSRFEAHPLRDRFAGVKAEWAFGGGAQAVTFVSRADEEHYLEQGLSYYRASGKMGVTPGHRSTAGERYRTLDPGAAILRCFQCHSTGPLKLKDDFAIEPFETGVQCESCHGAGSEHAATPNKRLRNPAKMAGAEMNEMCGACHRQPPKSAYETDWNDPWNVRHQPVYFSQSACFLKGKLTCSACHAAHQPVSRKAAGYDAVCASCHKQPRHRAIIAGKSCSGCHMPAVAPNHDLRFANHWIGVYATGGPLRPISRR